MKRPRPLATTALIICLEQNLALRCRAPSSSNLPAGRIRYLAEPIPRSDGRLAKHDLQEARHARIIR